MGRFDKEIRIIRENCYKANLMDLAETRMVNKALDCAIQSMMDADELNAYRKARKEITDTIDAWMNIDNGKCRGLFLAESIMAHHVDAEKEKMTNEEAIKWLKVFEENEGHCPEGMDYAEFFDKVAEAIQRSIDVMGEMESEG